MVETRSQRRAAIAAFIDIGTVEPGGTETGSDPETETVAPETASRLDSETEIPPRETGTGDNRVSESGTSEDSPKCLSSSKWFVVALRPWPTNIPAMRGSNQNLASPTCLLEPKRPTNFK